MIEKNERDVGRKERGKEAVEINIVQSSLFEQNLLKYCKQVDQNRGVQIYNIRS